MKKSKTKFLILGMSTVGMLAFAAQQAQAQSGDEVLVSVQSKLTKRVLLNWDPTTKVTSLTNAEGQDITNEVEVSANGKAINIAKLQFPNQRKFSIIENKAKLNFTCEENGDHYDYVDGKIDVSLSKDASEQGEKPVFDWETKAIKLTGKLTLDLGANESYLSGGAVLDVKDGGSVVAKSHLNCNAIQIEKGGAATFNYGVHLGGALLVDAYGKLNVEKSLDLASNAKNILFGELNLADGAFSFADKTFEANSTSIFNINQNANFSTEFSDKFVSTGTFNVNDKGEFVLSGSKLSLIDGAINVNKGGKLVAKGDVQLKSDLNVNSFGELALDGNLWLWKNYKLNIANTTGPGTFSFGDGAKGEQIFNLLSGDSAIVSKVTPTYYGSNSDVSVFYKSLKTSVADQDVKAAVEKIVSSHAVKNFTYIPFTVSATVSTGSFAFDFNHSEIKSLLNDLGSYRVLKYKGNKWVDASASNENPLATSTSDTSTDFILVGYQEADPIVPPTIIPSKPDENKPANVLPSTGTKPTLSRVGSKDRKVKLGKSVKLQVKTTVKGAVTWKSQNSKIAKVDKTGKIVALKSGTTTITATNKAGQKVTFKITVDKVKKTLKVSKKTTLKALAKKLKVKVADLKKWNKNLAKKTFVTQAKVSYYTNGVYHEKSVYTTTKKESLKVLAKQLKVKESDLKKWNKSLAKTKFVNGKVKVVYYI